MQKGVGAGVGKRAKAKSRACSKKEGKVVMAKTFSEGGKEKETNTQH